MYAIKVDGQWTEFLGQALPLIDWPEEDMENNSFYVPIAWSDEEKEEKFGVVRVPDPEVPAGKYVLSWTLEDFAGRPKQVVELGDIPVPPVVYPNITARQIRLMLLTINVSEADIDALLANDQEGMIEWKYASTFRRDHPLINQLAANMSLPEEVVDMLWLNALEFQ